MCHLEADMVHSALHDWDMNERDFLFIENVGNLVCPSSWDLGEDLRVLLFAVTEGEDKPLKYPTLINTADVVVMSKMDIAAAVDFDLDLALRNIQLARPGVEVIQVSARTGEGMDGVDRLFAERGSSRNGATASGFADGVSAARWSDLRQLSRRPWHCKLQLPTRVERLDRKSTAAAFTQAPTR